MAVQSPPSSATGLYCYGVVAARDANKPTGGGGLDGKPVKTVVHDDLAALVSEAPGSVRAKRRDLMAHLDVLGTAFEHGTVLPARFGIVFDDEESLVRELLAPRRKELVHLLKELDDRVELRVTAHHRPEQVLAETVVQNPRIAKLREATRGAAGAHPALIELGELVTNDLRRRVATDAQTLLGRLRPLSDRYELDPDPIEYQVLRGSFLVRRKRVPAFEEALQAFAAENADRIDVKLVGPLPPHSFVELTHGERR
jgi:gas vesicle protein GvpL/GvpF